MFSCELTAVVVLS